MTLLSECYHTGFQSSDFIKRTSKNQAYVLNMVTFAEMNRKHSRFSTQNEPVAHDPSSTAVSSGWTSFGALDCFKLAFATE